MYQIAKTEEGFIIKQDETIVVTHLGNELVLKDGNIATIAVNDFNAVGYFDLRNSFAYCVLSTLQESEAVSHKFENSCEPFIHWDGCFRLDPNPRISIFQNESILSLHSFLSNDWVNLPLNYSIDIEEMRRNETPFVPNSIIAKMNSLIQSFNQAELVSIDILNQQFDGRNYCMSALWIANLVTNEALIKSGLYLGYIKEDAYSNEFTDYEIQIINEDSSRLDGLRILLNSLRL
jgi:hypothetical protein